MRLSRYVAAALTASAAALACSSAFGQTIKIGFISSYSGPAAAQGDQLDKGAKLYMKLNADKLPPGVKVELVVRDDTGPNPDVAKRIAQELIVRDKVQFLTGVVWTPNAAAIARRRDRAPPSSALRAYAAAFRKSGRKSASALPR